MEHVGTYLDRIVMAVLSGIVAQNGILVETGQIFVGQGVREDMGAVGRIPIYLLRSTSR